MGTWCGCIHAAVVAGHRIITRWVVSRSGVLTTTGSDFLVHHLDINTPWWSFVGEAHAGGRARHGNFCENSIRAWYITGGCRSCSNGSRCARCSAMVLSGRRCCESRVYRQWRNRCPGGRRSVAGPSTAVRQGTHLRSVTARDKFIDSSPVPACNVSGWHDSSVCWGVYWRQRRWNHCRWI